METVTTLAEAQQFFLRQGQAGEKGQPTEKSVKCKKDSRHRICGSLDEAAKWYGGNKEDA